MGDNLLSEIWSKISRKFLVFFLKNRPFAGLFSSIIWDTQFQNEGITLQIGSGVPELTW
jgi:hypothetical protein